jgi:hypothetical protein
MSKTHFYTKILLLLSISFTVSFVVLSGCGHYIKTEDVHGVITLDGKPLDGASIAFTPKDSNSNAIPAYAQADVNGFYKLQTLLGRADAGTTEGEYIVTIKKTVEVPSGRFIAKEDGSKEDTYETQYLTPKDYFDQSKTPFTATVTRGKNEFNFDLTSSFKAGK